MSELVPKLRFKDFNAKWEVTTLNNISLKITDGTHDTPKKTSNGIPFITAVHVNDGSIDFENSYYISEHEHRLIYKRCNPELNDILVVNIGAGTATTALVDVNFEFSLKNVALLKLNKDIVNPNFISQVLRFNSKKWFHQLTSGGAQPFLSLKEISRYKVIYGNKQEQQKIADFLTSVDTKISQLTEKHRLLKEYKKGVMQQIFSQKIRFKDDDGKAFPEWENKKGNKVFDSISDKKHNSDLPILAITQEYGAIPRELINYDVQVTENSVSGYKVVQKGDFIISLRSFQGGIEYSQYHGICSPAYIILRPNIEVVDDFFKYYLKTHNFIQEMKKRLEGIRDGKILSYKYFSEINIPYPCVSEQQKIAQFLQSIDNKIDVVTEQIEQTKQFKKGLLQQMFV